MTFMEEVLQAARPVWDRCLETPFLRELRDGTLAVERFRRYMIQDSIYLKHYARMFGWAVYHAVSLEEIRMFYRGMGFVTERESAVRLSWLAEWGLTDTDVEEMDILPENRAYIAFLETAALQEDTAYMLMTTLPCMLSYSYIFRKTAAGCADSVYRDFIADYAEDAYAQECEDWTAFAQARCAGFSEERRRELQAVFEKGSLLELAFWKMAYGDCERRGK